jgi:multiple sugar transport system permease protein
VPAGASTRAGSILAKPDHRYAAVSILPSVLVVFAVVIYPLIYAVMMSFRDSRMGVLGGFIGLANYARLFSDVEFRLAIVRTLVLTVIAVALVIVISLGVAMVVNERFRGSSFIKLALLLPYALPGTLSALIWRWMYDPSYGILNAVLYHTGFIKEYVTFTGDPRTAMGAIILAHVWKFVPYSAFLFVAGLRSIPPGLYEAARIDGASSLTIFRKITLPLLAPAMQLALIVQTVFAVLYHFGLVYIITGGGPGRATTTLPWYVYSETFRFMQFGRGSAAAVVLALIMLVFIYVYLVALSPKERTVS